MLFHNAGYCTDAAAQPQDRIGGYNLMTKISMALCTKDNHDTFLLVNYLFLMNH